MRLSFIKVTISLQDVFHPRVGDMRQEVFGGNFCCCTASVAYGHVALGFREILLMSVTDKNLHLKLPLL